MANRSGVDMGQPADFRLESRGDKALLSLIGDWNCHGVGRVGERLAREISNLSGVALDLVQLGSFDTAGAYILIRSAQVTTAADGLSARPDVLQLIRLVSTSVFTGASASHGVKPSAYGVLSRIGYAVLQLGRELFDTLIFHGRLLDALGRVLAAPRRLRLTPTVSLMERTGLDALPIVVLTSFFVGATIGFLGEDLLNQFGAQIYSVELIGIGVLREFGVLVTAIILSGRSASSFAAEIGAMRMNQEVAAMEVMGVDPFEALVIPRFLAMLVMTPLLTFLAMIAGLAGGLLVIWSTAGLSPAFFLQRLLDNVGVSQFYIGMVKAPVMAVVIAAIGCRQGLEVGGDVEQLGRRVTAAVVQALFSVILIDAVFALAVMAIGQ